MSIGRNTWISASCYPTAEDVPQPIDLEQVDTALGPATVVGQEYYECTNSCTEWVLDIAIIELTEPRNPAFPTLSIMLTGDDLDRDDLLAILGGLDRPLSSNVQPASPD